MESLKCFLVALAIIVVVVLAFAPAADAQEPIPTIPIDEPWTPVPPTAEPSQVSLGPGSLNFWSCDRASITYGGEVFTATLSGEQIESPEFSPGTEIVVSSGGYTVTLLIWGDRLRMEPSWFGGDVTAAWCPRPEQAGVSMLISTLVPTPTPTPTPIPTQLGSETVLAGGPDTRQSLAATPTPTPTPLRSTGFAGQGTMQSSTGQATPTPTPIPQSTAVGARTQNHSVFARAFLLQGAPYAQWFWVVLGLFLLVGLVGWLLRRQYAQEPGGS